MNLPVDAQRALETFSSAAGWEARSRLLLQWASGLPDVEERRDQDLVHGCESQVWLTHRTEHGLHHFQASSDSRILRGLLSVLLARANGLTTEELEALDIAAWLNELGLEHQLSASRGNGLRAVVQRMRELASD